MARFATFAMFAALTLAAPAAHALEPTDLPATARVTLTGAALPQGTLDLATAEGLEAFMEWGSEHASAHMLNVSAFPSARYPWIVCWSFGALSEKCRLFRKEETRVVYLDLDGSPDALYRIGNAEYLLVDDGMRLATPRFTRGHLINLATGDRSKEEFGAHGFAGVLLATDGTVYLKTTHVEMARDTRTTTTIATADGVRAGALIGPSGVEFISADEVRGIALEECGGSFLCNIQYTLDVRTGDIRTEFLNRPPFLSVTDGE